MPGSCSEGNTSTHAQQVYGGIGDQVRDANTGAISMHPVGGTFAAQSGGQRKRYRRLSGKKAKTYGGAKKRGSRKGKRGPKGSRRKRSKSCSLWGGNTGYSHNAQPNMNGMATMNPSNQTMPKMGGGTEEGRMGPDMKGLDPYEMPSLDPSKKMMGGGGCAACGSDPIMLPRV